VEVDPVVLALVLVLVDVPVTPDEDDEPPPPNPVLVVSSEQPTSRATERNPRKRKVMPKE
jgi:hypothetical protein